MVALKGEKVYSLTQYCFIRASGGSVDRDPPACRRHHSVLGWESLKKSSPTPVFLPGDLKEGAWWVTVMGVLKKDLDTSDDLLLRTVCETYLFPSCVTLLILTEMLHWLSCTRDVKHEIKLQNIYLNASLPLLLRKLTHALLFTDCGKTGGIMITIMESKGPLSKAVRVVTDVGAPSRGYDSCPWKDTE